MRIDPVNLFIATLALTACAAFPPTAVAESAVEIQGTGSLSMSDSGAGVLRLSGTASHLGKFRCFAEIVFLPGDEQNSLDGEGVAAFTAANGDMLVGVIAWHIHADGTGQIEFHWRDSVTFGDGSMVASSGHFADHRPPGARVASLVNEGSVATLK